MTATATAIIMQEFATIMQIFKFLYLLRYVRLGQSMAMVGKIKVLLLRGLKLFDFLSMRN